MAKIIESYKITVFGHANHRRETEKAAMALAEKLKKQRKHGMVEAVVWDNEKTDSLVEFVKVKEF